MFEQKIAVEYLYLLRDLQQLSAVELAIGEDRYLCRTELAGTAIRPSLQITKLENKNNPAKERDKQEYFKLTLFPDTEEV